MTEFSYPDDAACRGMDLAIFFPGEHQGRNACDEAVAVCETCPVTAECLEESLAHGFLDHGVWGGLRPSERRTLRRSRRAPSAHGTRARYVAGCRCLDCARANREYQFRWSQARRAQGLPA